jgi:hypothetical protein
MTANDRPGDAALISALLSGSTIKAAAVTSGMSESTARRRLRDPQFVAELNTARREVVASVVARLAGLADLACAALHQLLDEASPAPQRLGAAREALRHLAVLSETAESADMSERLARVERRLGLTAVEEDAA